MTAKKFTIRTLPENRSYKEQIFVYNGEIFERGEEILKSAAHEEYLRDWKDVLSKIESSPHTQKMETPLTNKLKNAYISCPSTNQINEVLGTIHRTSLYYDEINPPGFIPFRDGLLNLATRKM